MRFKATKWPAAEFVFVFSLRSVAIHTGPPLLSIAKEARDQPAGR